MLALLPLLVSCRAPATKPPVAYTRVPFTAILTVEAPDAVYTGDFALTPTGATLSLTAPDSLAGCTLTKEGDTLTVSFAGMEAALPAHARPLLAQLDEALTEANAGEAALLLDEAGLPQRLELPEEGVTCTFSGAAAS